MYCRFWCSWTGFSQRTLILSAQAAGKVPVLTGRTPCHLSNSILYVYNAAVLPVVQAAARKEKIGLEGLLVLEDPVMHIKIHVYIIVFTVALPLLVCPLRLPPARRRWVLSGCWCWRVRCGTSPPPRRPPWRRCSSAWTQGWRRWGIRTHNNKIICRVHFIHHMLQFVMVRPPSRRCSSAWTQAWRRWVEGRTLSWSAGRVHYITMVVGAACCSRSVSVALPAASSACCFPCLNPAACTHPTNPPGRHRCGGRPRCARGP